MTFVYVLPQELITLDYQTSVKRGAQMHYLNI